LYLHFCTGRVCEAISNSVDHRTLLDRACCYVATPCQKRSRESRLLSRAPECGPTAHNLSTRYEPIKSFQRKSSPAVLRAEAGAASLGDDHGFFHAGRRHLGVWDACDMAFGDPAEATHFTTCCASLPSLPAHPQSMHSLSHLATESIPSVQNMDAEGDVKIYLRRPRFLAIPCCRRRRSAALRLPFPIISSVLHLRLAGRGLRSAGTISGV